MRSAHTQQQVRAAEAALAVGLPAGTLMQRAATGLAHAVVGLLGSAYGRRVTLLVGGGDNGGDALLAGALLARRGVAVEAVLLADEVHAAGLAALRAAGGRVRRGLGEDDGAGARRRLPEVVVDGIVGIGGRPGLRPDARRALEVLAPAGSGVKVVAVDVPSGVEVDTGRLPEGDHVRADLTVTFGTHKVAHLVDPAAAAAGAVHLVDIGLGPHLPLAEVEALQAADVAALLPRPAPDAHKYVRGVVGVRAGSGRYPGAGLLAVAGAATGLVGMVRYVGDPAVLDRVRHVHPEVVGVGRVQAWTVGSGGDERAGAALRAALADGVPVVVDAEALRHVDPEQGLPVPAVLTPHAGELASMLGVERAAVEADPLAHARRAAERHDAVVLLKGRRSVVARPDGRARVVASGTPWLATAGAGDVLGGLVGALLAAGLTPYDAASAGAWLHGAAATYASQGGPITAGQVADAIPEVVRDLLVGLR
ncbi:NAD(P)H-hydrate dehydratase [Nocardioides sp. ChNu-153]|uniref:NAD(P)H-hydrate dehydratase n=1 Tax=Nocardioides sp. ChNu-153 TaxID=2779364 RepID=UPI002652EEF4|nr:NAD(P)H-hydrate dehydratase [Nocardioides sp. ChNu-153]MDN7120037.1 NAD(P)H-hydrate dehydratase [Nocardioides sp. ChNu-153]